MSFIRLRSAVDAFIMRKLNSVSISVNIFFVKYFPAIFLM